MNIHFIGHFVAERSYFWLNYREGRSYHLYAISSLFLKKKKKKCVGFSQPHYFQVGKDSRLLLYLW